jgi:hypothetical protein
MSALADALEAYEMAIALGADSITRADRLQDLINADAAHTLQDVINTGKADITRTYEKEQR